jgi:fatty acid desaturase
MTDEESQATELAATADSIHKRKHKKYRYRRTGATARKVLLIVGVVAFWVSLLAGWYYLVTLDRATPR